MIKKYRKIVPYVTILCSIACIGGVVAMLVHQTEPATKKPGYQYRVMLDAFPFEEEGSYSKYNYGNANTPELLFGEQCEYIFYGKILEARPFSTNTAADLAGSGSLVYAYALLKTEVLKGIHGGLDKGQKVYLVMPYSGDDDSHEAEMIPEGTEGMFIPRMPTVEVTFVDSQKKVDAIGMVGMRDHRFCCREEYLSELKELNSLEEVRDFWEENRLYFDTTAHNRHKDEQMLFVSK